MPLDPRLEQVLTMLTDAPKPVGTPAQRREQQLSTHREVAALRGQAPGLHEVRDLTADSPDGSVPIRVYRPDGGVLPAYVYIHGGGWWGGTLDLFDAICRRRASATPCVVISVDYRLAPEHPFPTPLNDCWNAVKWVVAHAKELGIDPSRIAIGGESAGANLAAAVALLSRDEPAIRFVAQVLEVPALDLTLTASSGSLSACGTGYGLDESALAECVQFYVQEHDPKDPLVSPLHATLAGLPPAFVTIAEFDPLRDDGIAYAAKLQEAGVPATLSDWPGQVHASMEFAGLVPDVAAAYLEKITGFLRSAFLAGV